VFVVGLRQKGYSQKQIDEELAKLRKNAPILKRLEVVLQKTDVRSKGVPKNLRNDLKRLVQYRNQCAHDEPRLYASFGQMRRFERHKGQTEAIWSGIKKRRPSLGDTIFPLHLADAIWAAQVHDALAKILFKRYRSGLATMHLLPESDLILSEGMLGLCIGNTDPVERIRRLASLWQSEAISWVNNVSKSEAQLRDFYSAFQRLMLHVVEPNA